MARTFIVALVAAVSLSACMAPTDMVVANRADNDMLRFSTSQYIPSRDWPE